MYPLYLIARLLQPYSRHNAGIFSHSYASTHNALLVGISWNEVGKEDGVGVCGCEMFIALYQAHHVVSVAVLMFCLLSGCLLLLLLFVLLITFFFFFYNRYDGEVSEETVLSLLPLSLYGFTSISVFHFLSMLLYIHTHPSLPTLLPSLPLSPFPRRSQHTVKRENDARMHVSPFYLAAPFSFAFSPSTISGNFGITKDER